MKKLFLLICCLFLLVLSADAMMLIGGRPPGGVCSESYNPGWTSDTVTRGVGALSSVDYYGILYTPISDECVCKVLIYNEQIDGTLSSSHDYYVRIFSLSGVNIASTLGTSSKVDGDGMSNDTWNTFEFSSCVNLTGSTQYGIGAFVDQDGNLNDNPEHDATNHWNFGDDNNNNGDAITGGRIHWDQPTGNGNLDDATDDPLFVIWTE